ncbi:hypothetical protein PCURB6_20200 [Paenibacillus curdlanolyticus]|nr:hypothetical protein PCURB6_20200 [Paenibacillus curdlanolyticus]
MLKAALHWMIDVIKDHTTFLTNLIIVTYGSYIYQIMDILKILYVLVVRFEITSAKFMPNGVK